MWMDRTAKGLWTSPRPHHRDDEGHGKRPGQGPRADATQMSRSGLVSSSMFTSLNVTTRTVRTKREER